VEGVAPVKSMDFEDYPSIATRGTGRKFINVQVNCTQYLADLNHNYTVYKTVPVMEDEYSGTVLQMQPNYHLPVTQFFK
jgi:hypothetical protein